MCKIKSYLDVAQDGCSQMNEETTRFYLECAILEERQLKGKGQLLFTEESARYAGTISQIIWDRLAHSGTKISFPLAMVVSHLSEDSPSKAVLWAWTLLQMAKPEHLASARQMLPLEAFGGEDTGCDLVLADLSCSFPWGFPLDEACLVIWDDQKSSDAPLNNRIDVLKVWE